MAALMEIMEALNKMPQNNLTAGYAEQLRIIEESLAHVEDAESRAAIEDLKRDLTELMELTKTTVEQTEEHVLAAEEKRFREELAMLEEGINEEEEDAQHKMEIEPGKIYQAPHEHTWGSIAYHNAIVSTLEDVYDDEDGKNIVYARVFFTNPTHREMLPCNYYLDGDCRFDAENCHFSHGELVNAAFLREYKAPEFERLKKNCLVLAKLDDKLWHRGRVISADFLNKKCYVRLDADYKGARERAFEFEELLPIFNDVEDDTSSSDSEEEENLSNDTNDCQNAPEINENIMEIHIKQPLGEWEKHTRGIGSKLMMKMGYIPGNGLGCRGKGITVPISAQVLPQGCSLDTCMQLREQANGDKDLFSVERKLKREQKKQEQINARAYERESKRVDVFSFLNEAVLKTQETEDKPQKSHNKNSMQQQTTKSLNVAQMQISDNIRRKSREISQMQESFRRQSNGTETYKRLQAQINIKNQELQVLKREERSLSKEQAKRRTTEKFVVF